MKKLITIALLFIFSTTYSQSIDKYEKQLSSYLYLSIDHDGLMDCLDSTKSAITIELTESSDIIVMDCSEFTLNKFYSETITDDLLFRMFEKINKKYLKILFNRRKPFTRTGYQMSTLVKIKQDIEEPEMIFGKTYVTFKIYFQ
jgi:hypothetical protein